MKLFTIAVSNSGVSQHEMNAFLRGHRILEIAHYLHSSETWACWFLSAPKWRWRVFPSS